MRQGTSNVRTGGPNQSWYVAILQKYSIWVVLMLLVLGMGLLSDVFLTWGNIFNVLRQASIIGIVAVGMTFVIIGGGFDLSVGAVLAFSAIISIQMQPVTPGRTALAVLLPLLVGVATGTVNGFLVGFLRVNPFITTLGMQFVVLGITLLYTNGQHVWVWNPDPVYAAIGGGFLGPVPIPVLIFAGVVALGHLVLSYTNFGQYLMATGANEGAAVLSGIRTLWIKVASFIIVGTTAALGGVVLGSRVKNLDPTAGIGYEFEIITAVVLGGTSLLGGKGSVLNTVAGVLILILIANAMTLLNISHHYQLVIRGLILVGSVALDASSRRRTA